MNRINEIKYKKIKDKKNNIICKSSSNNFSINKIHKSPINYIITKIQKNFKIKASKVKANDFIITKNINNFKIKGIDYSEVTIDVILYISDTYELTINSTKKKETQKSYKIIKVINNYMIDIKKEQYKKNDYMFDNNKLIINKNINNVKIIKNKKEDFIINKFKSNNFSIIRGINNKKTNLVINNGTFKDLTLSKINSFDKFNQLYNKGKRNRLDLHKDNNNRMNIVFSYSHSILTLNIFKDDNTLLSKIFFIDLGSRTKGNMSFTQNRKTFNEVTSMNNSLSNLEDTIKSLAKKQVCTFRQDKFLQAIKQCFDNNCYLSFIMHCADLKKYKSDTMITLDLAKSINRL